MCWGFPWIPADSHFGMPRIQGSKCTGSSIVCPHVGLPENGAGNLLDFHPFSNYLATSLWRMTSWRNQPISWANISGLGIDIFEYWWRPNLSRKTGENGADMIDGAISLPVVPHKAVAEVSKIGHCRRGELLWCMDGRAIPLMDGKVVVVTSPTTAGSVL